MPTSGFDREDAKLRRDRELSRVLRAHEDQIDRSAWQRFREAPSKFSVDILANWVRREYRNISPRTYENFDDEEFRDGICRNLGTPYDELPDFVPIKKTFGSEFPVWWIGGSFLFVGAASVYAFVSAFIFGR